MGIAETKRRKGVMLKGAEMINDSDLAEMIKQTQKILARQAKLLNITIENHLASNIYLAKYLADLLEIQKQRRT